MRYLSLFSGIEAASVAWHHLDADCVAVADIEPYACAVLQQRFPTVVNLGDVTTITEAQIAALGQIDLVVFGSPCQDLSVAGQRKGLDGARSGLFFTAINIINWAVRWNGTRFALWENVPGAFSSAEGRDFAAVVGHLAGLDHVDCPPKGWGTEGCAVGDKALVEWSTLDAQWFGVAQRRRRVFALADFGDWASRPPILLERDGLRGDSAPRREAWEGPATHAADSAAGGCWWDGGQVSQTLDAVLHKGQTMPEKNRFPAVLVNSPCPFCGHPFDQDELGRYGCPNCEGNGVLAFDTTQITSATNRNNPKPGDPCHPLAAGAHPPAIAFKAGQSEAAGGVFITEEFAPTLQAMNNGSTAVPSVAYAVALRGRDGGATAELGDDLAHTLRASGGGGDKPHVLTQAMQVRRLTPIECERLQGFPDDWTRVKWRGKDTPPDGPRYKALGNSMAVPVMRWIGTRVDFVLRYYP